LPYSLLSRSFPSAEHASYTDEWIIFGDPRIAFLTMRRPIQKLIGLGFESPFKLPLTQTV
jgi:hypothetical protein